MPSTPPLVIVGGGPAALAGARGHRAAGGDAPILMLTEEDRPPYLRPPLSKELLRGEAGEDELQLADAGWYADQGVEVRCGVVVEAIDTDARAVTVRGERIEYSACLLATGSEPHRPPIPGAGLPAVHVLRSLRDALALRAATEAGTRVLIAGSGFIGCEAAASLATRGARVRIVTRDAAPQAARLGAAVSSRLTGWLTDLGVSLSPDRSVDAVRAREGALIVAAGGRELDVDLVLLATGARPRVTLARDAGLRMEQGAVRTDSGMRTSAPGVWCAGDPALADNPGAGRALRVEHWGDAIAQGEVAGRVMAGEDAAWDRVPGFWSTIGRRTLKQAAWGDGWDAVDLRAHDGGGFTVWYGRGGRVVGVLTHEADTDYERGSRLVREGAAWPP